MAEWHNWYLNNIVLKTLYFKGIWIYIHYGYGNFKVSLQKDIKNVI